jgi:hypothetical protein
MGEKVASVTEPIGNILGFIEKLFAGRGDEGEEDDDMA